MEKNILLTIIKRSLITGVICWLVFSFAASISSQNLSFPQMLFSWPGIGFGIVAFLGSFIGLWRKTRK